ncbi:MAG TPA: hypothetical protein VFS39_18725 [Nitrospira sp.]|nr:hypothetical protein [Nitrospira sp.]
MEALFDMQLSPRADEHPTDNSLYGPPTGLKERGGCAPYVCESSLYTQASLHPFLMGAAAALAGATLASVFRAGARSPSDSRQGESRGRREVDRPSKPADAVHATTGTEAHRPRL